MSLRKLVGVFECDAAGCDELFVSEVDGIDQDGDQATAQAMPAGWTQVRVKHYCPAHRGTGVSP